jgi:hypothetical protein
MDNLPVELPVHLKIGWWYAGILLVICIWGCL